jgi:hypothetical protein
MTRFCTIVTLALLFVIARPAPAEADITAFWGASMTPSSRLASGFSVGVSLLVLGFEFEYGNVREDLDENAPSLKTYMFNGLVQTPTPGLQLYATAGGGIFRERLDPLQETSFGTNVGGGVKARIAGPLRLRADFRIFNLRGEAIHKHPKRFYVGANIAF